MLALALEIAIKVAMGNHLYSFNGSVRLQLVGGPIGNQLSGALAKVYMLSIAGDKRTAMVIKSIANSICDSVQMEIDFPSHYEDGWMPLLNLQIRENSDNSIDYKWFGKKVTNHPSP